MPLHGEEPAEDPKVSMESSIRLPHSARTTHFKIYHQDPMLKPGLLSDLEGIHAKLIMDLVLFSPWAKSESISLYLYSSPEEYRAYTGQMEWSSGAANVSARSVHVYDQERLNLVLAHELSHVLLGDFFEKEGSDPPKWIYEGVAMLMELEASVNDNAGDHWIKFITAKFKNGEGMTIARLTAFNPQRDLADTPLIQDWYAQSYSLVRYLLRVKGNSHQFHKFCKELRDGVELPMALKSIYGWEFGDLEAFERSWRRSL